jgi:hypothetical protein
MVNSFNDEDFQTIYRDLGFMVPSSKDYLPLHECCNNSSDCWRGAEDRKPPSEKECSKISRPWVGSKYCDLRLVAVGENLYECGGFDALSTLVKTANKEMVQTGRKRVRFGFPFSKYRGSLLWHRLGCYTAAFAEDAGLIRPSYADNFPATSYVATAFDYVAYTNHIKCSPKKNMSKPTEKMWEKCGSYVLRKELLKLEPERILVLGTGENFCSFRSNVLDPGCPDPTKTKTVQTVSGMLGQRPVRVFAVQHPSSRLGANSSIFKDLQKILKLKGY